MSVTQDQIMEALDGMTVAELNKLYEALLDKWAIDPASLVMSGGGGGGGEVAAVEEKTSFNVNLEGAGDAKIQVIKAVREITGLGLKEAKDLVDGAPKPLKEGVSKDEADDIKKKIEEAGGVVSIK